MAVDHLDKDVLTHLRDVMEGEYRTLLDTFLEDSQERVEALRKARDTKVLGEIAHSFKGSSSNLGAVRLVELCHRLETEAANQSLQALEPLVDEIGDEFAFVRPLYELERQRYPF
ncbi:Hpt domain-containing protein [Pseudomonas sp. CCM 7893]|uniref:Hpt domain-containing protein n=1 Tax=Pseudomonas spelaei TaxID=1055469 RepID=A0A6I3W5Z4_9PSED|nr:Hpt domain-containing protein [Pseudomonas spelaei]